MKKPTSTAVIAARTIATGPERAPRALPHRTEELLLEIKGAAATLRLVSQTTRRDDTTQDLETSFTYIFENLTRSAQELRETLNIPRLSRLN